MQTDLDVPLGDAPISTPDRRVRVFVSSTMRELADERRAVRDAVVGLRLTPILFETGARHHPPRELYRAYLAQSDVFVGIYWQQYGWVAPEESVSGLEDEYLLSGAKPKLIYVKSAEHRDTRLEDLLDRVRNDDGVAYKHFDHVDELADLVADDLAVLLTERFTARTGPVTPALRPGRIPTPSVPIVGRASELERVTALLEQPSVRLVTLLGPSGMGKTRLALELASEIRDAPSSRFDGVWFVDLTPVVDPAQVLETIGAALGVHTESRSSLIDVMAERLAGKSALLVLDNFEQVLGAAPALAELLTACPGVSALITSRSVLHLRGELEITVAPLGTPRAESSDLPAVAHTSAVQLFVSRARQVRPDFTLTAQNAGAVAELCRRLDGMPLAIELAASHLRILSPSALLARLGKHLSASLDLRSGSLDLPDRQRTLRATLSWSYSLLSEPEQLLLERLSVFTDSWTLESAEAVGAADGLEVLEGLSTLVAQSLVFPSPRSADEPRFGMLDTIRAYARERLADRGEIDSTRDALTQYLLQFAHTAGRALDGPDNKIWVARIDDELPDLRSESERAIRNNQPATVIGLSAPLFSYWWSHGLLTSMNVLAEAAAALPAQPTLPPEAAVSLLFARGMFRLSSGRSTEAEPFLRELLAGDVQGIERLRALALVGLGLIRAGSGTAGAAELVDQGIAVFRSRNDNWGLAFALSARGQIALLHGEQTSATAMHQEGLQIAGKIANDHLQAQLLDQLGVDALADFDIIAARTHLTAAAEIHQRLRDQEGSAYCIDGFAAIAIGQGRFEVAGRLLGPPHTPARSSVSRSGRPCRP